MGTFARVSRKSLAATVLAAAMVAGVGATAAQAEASSSKSQMITLKNLANFCGSLGGMYSQNRWGTQAVCVLAGKVIICDGDGCVVVQSNSLVRADIRPTIPPTEFRSTP